MAAIEPPFNCTCAGGEHDLAHAADCPVRIAHESDRYANHPFTTSPERAIEPPSKSRWRRWWRELLRALAGR